MSYTLAEAAIAVGMDKSTVRRAVRAGRISGTRDEAGVWHVEAVELHRVFPPTARTEGDTTAVPRDAPPDAATDALVAELRAVIADLRQDRDDWRDQAKRLVLAAPVAVAVPAPAPTDDGSPLYRAWRWVRKAG